MTIVFSFLPPNRPPPPPPRPRLPAASTRPRAQSTPRSGRGSSARGRRGTRRTCQSGRWRQGVSYIFLKKIFFLRYPQQRFSLEGMFTKRFFNLSAFTVIGHEKTAVFLLVMLLLLLLLLLVDNFHTRVPPKPMYDIKKKNLNSKSPYMPC